MTKIFITKYALTSGPFVVDGELKDDMAIWKSSEYRQYAHGNEWWLTEEDALKDCERRRQNKLKSIDKQREKLESMEFKITEMQSN